MSVVQAVGMTLLVVDVVVAVPSATREWRRGSYSQAQKVVLSVSFALLVIGLALIGLSFI